MKLVKGLASVYESTQHYGGPEEGGWYYHNAEHVEVLEEVNYMVRTIEYDFTNAEEYENEVEAVDFFNGLLGQMLEERYADRYNFGNNQYGEGFFLAFEENVGEHADDERPHYE